jgi:2-keto-3-deoxy-L-rhamnonate aldolase RhmA
MKGTFGLNTCPDTTRCVTSGLDFYIIDREHGRASLSEAAMLLSAIHEDCQKFIRVSSCQRIEIQRVLELLPDGILIPQISSYDDALSAVQYSFFPPIGSRGLSPYTRGFGFHHSDLADKKIKINQNLKLGLLIEGESGFKALPSILENLSSHIDLIYFGLFDFASSQNVEPDWDNKELGDLLSDVIEKVGEKGIQVGTIARTKKDLERLKKMGVTYIVYLNDLGIIRDAVKELENC